MKTTGNSERIKPIYKEWVEVPDCFRKIVWDALDGKSPLEDIILKVLMYGSFEEIKKLFKMYPEETYNVAFRYPEIKRGVRYWIKVWSDDGRSS